MSFDLATYKAEIIDRKRRLLGEMRRQVVVVQPSGVSAVAPASEKPKPVSDDAAQQQKRQQAMELVDRIMATPVEETDASIMDIIKAVAAKHGLQLRDIIGATRGGSVVAARHEAMFVSRYATKKSLPTIGRVFNRDHTTVFHGVHKHAERMVEASLIVDDKPTCCPLCGGGLR